MGDPDDCPKCGKREKKEILSMLREMWLKGGSPLHRIYSSWEELEANVKITSDKEKHSIQPCPNCGTKQNIAKPMEGIFPYQNCKSCKHPFYVNKDLTVRQLTDEERREIPGAWFQIVEDISKKKVAVVFRLE
jgi:ribosomal protein L37AE/L43A